MLLAQPMCADPRAYAAKTVEDVVDVVIACLMVDLAAGDIIHARSVIGSANLNVEQQKRVYAWIASQYGEAVADEAMPPSRLGWWIFTGVMIVGFAGALAWVGSTYVDRPPTGWRRFRLHRRR